MPIIVSEIFSKKSSIWSDILYNHQFYHADFRWKASVLSENISTSLFNYMQLVFVCTSFYLSIFPSKSSILSIILCSPQIYHTYITWKSSLLYKNISISFFNYILIVLICLSMFLRFFKKVFNFINYVMVSSFYHTYIQFYKLCHVILIFIIHILDENSQFYMKMFPCLFGYILIVFLCLSLYLSFAQINLQFYQLPE